MDASQNTNDSRAAARRWRIASVAAMVVTAAAVAVTGLRTDEPMIGDEVTHYYMVVTQASKLPGANVHAQIPQANGRFEERRYPHVFLWHYVGAVAWKCLGANFRAVQSYHWLYFVQLLIAMWALARKEEDGDSPATLLYLLTASSVPMLLLFGVVLYQDVPALAQLLTALALLRRRRILLSLGFFVFGLGIKITLFPLIPAYLACIFVLEWRDKHRVGAFVWSIVASAVIAGTCIATAKVLASEEVSYYPVEEVRKYIERLGIAREGGAEGVAGPVSAASPAEPVRPEIAQNPGDLRNPVNFLLYGGGLLWIVLAAGVAALAFRNRLPGSGGRPAVWLLLFGGWQLAITAYHMRTAPDARFFLPGVVLVLLPACQYAARLPWRQYWLPTLTVVAALQAGVVLAKIDVLRRVRPGVYEAVEYLTKNPVPGGSVFMYPEGNYRLFPCLHYWYLDYRLKDFWRGDNDYRMRLLGDYGIRAIIIKKYLVGQIDAEMNNLGIYPDYFVEQIAADSRFRKVFENQDIVIYLLPESPQD